MPRRNPSAADISTWVAVLTGPSTRTFSITPFGPTSVSVSAQANCPGCDSSLLFVRLAEPPNNMARSCCDKWTCRLDTPTGIVNVWFSSCLTTASVTAATSSSGRICRSPVSIRLFLHLFQYLPHHTGDGIWRKCHVSRGWSLLKALLNRLQFHRLNPIG